MTKPKKVTLSGNPPESIEAHAGLYAQEFSFRYSNRKLSDWDATAIAVEGSNGKKLVYKATVGKS